MSNIVILFPGVGYTTDKPLIYYASALARKAGYDESRKIKYTLVNKDSIRGNKEAMKATFDAFYMQVEEQLADINWEEYDNILFVSKSIGTVIATAYANKHKHTGIKHILYTPLDYTFNYGVEKGIAFIGTEDGWTDYKEVVKLAEENKVPITVYEKCNHSLESDDTIENIKRIENIMKITSDYLKRGIDE